jgi:hypothetical protein
VNHTPTSEQENDDDYGIYLNNNYSDNAKFTGRELFLESLADSGTTSLTVRGLAIANRDAVPNISLKKIAGVIHPTVASLKIDTEGITHNSKSISWEDILNGSPWDNQNEMLFTTDFHSPKFGKVTIDNSLRSDEQGSGEINLYDYNDNYFYGVNDYGIYVYDREFNRVSAWFIPDYEDDSIRIEFTIDSAWNISAVGTYVKKSGKIGSLINKIKRSNGNTKIEINKVDF